MTIQSADPFWCAALQGCETDLALWLRNHSSLTLSIQKRCKDFAVRGVRTDLARIALDESMLLQIAPQQLAYSREVFLYADEKPVVFAHSTFAYKNLRGAWKAVRSLDSKPLGAMLFTHPLVKRRPLHYKLLRSVHPLYKRAVSILDDPPQRLWARRSLFYLHDAPLLVTEVFLPGILQLSKR